MATGNTSNKKTEEPKQPEQMDLPQSERKQMANQFTEALRPLATPVKFEYPD